MRAKGRYEYFDWRFASSQGDVTIEGHIHAPRSSFVGLPYRNPPGGVKTCLNTKIASCELTLKVGGVERTLRSASRTAFEILTDDTDHGVRVLEP